LCKSLSLTFITQPHHGYRRYFSQRAGFWGHWWLIKKNTSKWPKKKLSGAQQMRADYKKRIAAKAALRAKNKGTDGKSTT